MGSALWIGNPTLPAFAATFDALKKRLRVVVRAQTSDSQLPEVSDDCELVVIAESLPHEYGMTTIESLRRRHPALAVVRVVGPGCDGELRSNPPELAHRYSWLDAPTALARDCDALERGECPCWGRPLTRSVDERTLESDVGLPDFDLYEMHFGVLSGDAMVRAWLTDAVCFWNGHAIAIEGLDAEAQRTPLEALLWHVPSGDAAGELAAIRERLPHVEVIAVASFLRPADAARLRRAGITQIISLPVIDNALHDAMSAVVRTMRIANR